MLRYFYLLSLLICINFSFCYEYSSDSDSSKKSIIRRLKTNHRHKREKIQQRKHHDYDVYDKDPIAEIDVASFINNADDESISENDPYDLRYQKLRYGKPYKNYDSLSNEISKSDDDYSDMDAENLRNSPYMSINAPTEDKIISDKFDHGFNKIHQDNLNENIIGQNNRYHKEKKCLLKNIKLPFFSHNKSAIAKSKSDNKRKIYGFHIPRKGKVICKDSNENLSKQYNSSDNQNIFMHDNIKKRSYMYRLCPACRRKFIISKTLNTQRKRSNILKNTYDVRQKNFEDNLKNNKRHLNKYMDVSIPSSNKVVTFENLWNDRRKKREADDRNIERQKELEYLERRVESVTVNNRPCNKVPL